MTMAAIRRWKMRYERRDDLHQAFLSLGYVELALVHPVGVFRLMDEAAHR
jgi:hypothetical protein